MKNLRILLVEDELIWQKILDDKIRMALRDIGHTEYTIKPVKTFADAYQILQESYWDLLVTDIGLKDSSISHRQKLGIQLVELAKNQNTPVIVVSGTPVVNTWDVRNLFKEYNADYFKKGAFDNKEFISAVKEVLQKQLQYLPTKDKYPNNLKEYNDKQEAISVSPTAPIEVFFSYAHEDEELKDELVKHLSILKRQGVITAWHDREITAGTEWAGEIDTHLNTASVILLLISSDFLASDYCYDIELAQAMKRHATGEACIIPVILREVDWKGAVFGKLQALPKSAEPVTNWVNPDQAFTDIARGIRKAVEYLKERRC